MHYTNLFSNWLIFVLLFVRYYGPFSELDADQVKEEVEGMWRVLYKLAKTFHDNPGARRIAEMVRAKVEKFRQFLPVLQTVCNKGLQPRHWNRVKINCINIYKQKTSFVI